MTVGIVLALLASGALVFLFLQTPPARIAAILRIVLPGIVGLAGVGLLLSGRGAIGVLLLGFAYAIWLRLRASATVSPIGEARRSTVRSRFLEMTLDHDKDRMDGLVTEGPLAGAYLSELTKAELLGLRQSLSDDPDSVRLLDAYLDRRAPGWAADANPNDGGGLGGAPGTGAMTEKQAYEILGLEPGATLAEIREAHRRLMKRVHPDSGGTDFLAARINEAKAFLVDRHH